jgi:AcrR family transcriptional regulator
MTLVTTTLGRPRSAAADLAIREATLELLADEGYAGLTMSGVAGAAGVSTATLYRRWKSKVDLVVDVLLARAEEHPLPNTGSLAGDLREVLRNLVDKKQSAQSIKIMSAVVGESGRNPELATAFRTALVAPRRAQFAALFERAAARQEIGADVDYELATDLVFGPVYQRLLITGRPVTPRVASQLVDLVLKAVAP